MRRLLQALCKEATILLYLRHPNICSLIGVSELAHNGYSKLGLVTPWISRGDVTTFLAGRGWEQALAISFVR